MLNKLLIIFIPVGIPGSVIAAHVTRPFNVDWSDVGQIQFYVRRLPGRVLLGRITPSWKNSRSAADKQRCWSTTQ